MADRKSTQKAPITLEWRENGKRIRLSVGKDPQDAAARRLRKEAELNALNNGVPVLPENCDGNCSVAAAVAQFLEETELTKKPKTLAAYTTAGAISRRWHRVIGMI